MCRAMNQPPLQAVIIPVTPLQQNSTLLWCTKTMRGAFTDPGGDLERLKAAAKQHGVQVEKILLTHGHIDHCGSAKILADELGVKIEGPRSEEHTSELQSRQYLVCRLLLEKKNQLCRPRTSISD